MCRLVPREGRSISCSRKPTRETGTKFTLRISPSSTNTVSIPDEIEILRPQTRVDATGPTRARSSRQGRSLQAHKVHTPRKPTPLHCTQSHSDHPSRAIHDCQCTVASPSRLSLLGLERDTSRKTLQL
ncbi:hypothetical protein PGT21_024278 [Puccinia graminis f. sp. tritici]|uniref:Uncharacterized protein n=1 Tax=Puccinia graminis f. sp. tritici TaxID=56615 RepID=A0A5B0PKG4_PUCGR|nr:hypothetical protein PGT21_024278 [Puccinia graminis f. sp. tritici]